jgi:hypothetical protein
MGVLARYPIVLHQTFIEATRETGYRSTAAAVAELVDNSIQAGAKNVRIFIRHASGDEQAALEMSVLDDGSGMDTKMLRRALQFGGSMRFDDRTGFGRFGMGLPNASVSQARRVEVFTWRAPNLCLVSNLDVDDIAAGRVDEIPDVRRSPLPKWVQEYRTFSGTLVTWSKCDRLDNRRVSTIVRKLQEPLGRAFRYFIWNGIEIWINGEPVTGVDPLFLHTSSPVQGAARFGEPLTFEIRVPGHPGKTSMVRVRFAELPVAKWHDMPVEDKRKYGIVDSAGLSILRAKREVDYGWWFFGAKRRENYDSWWRGELSFEPDLDELFSITHSKQGINPTQELREILTPDLEAVARQLNSRVQAAFAAVKAIPPEPASVLPQAPRVTMKTERVVRRAELRPPTGDSSNGAVARAHPSPRAPEKTKGPGYDVSVQSLGNSGIFHVELSQARWKLILNSDHAFYKKAYDPLRGAARRHLEQLLLAHGQTVGKGRKRIDTAALQECWAEKLAELLEVDG